jgi:hypothetical protein
MPPEDEVRDQQASGGADDRGPHPFPASDLACRSAPEDNERRNPEGAVGNGSGDEPPADPLAEIRMHAF